MPFHQHYSLKKLNTFSIDAHAQYYATFKSADELLSLVQEAGSANLPLLLLGGGSNLLFTRDFPGLILKNEITGIQQVEEDNDAIYLKAGGGENWHAFVEHAIALGLGGVENLSLIPGSVGASPIQNIGAYGVELKDSFFELEALDLSTLKTKTFRKEDCAFGYRDSIFKRAYKNRVVILNVTFRLLKWPVINTTYGAIEHELQQMNIVRPTVRDISQAVINIRRSKLPDPALIGNAGSFFKNPEIPQHQFNQLAQQYPGIVGFPAVDNKIKVAAGWLIEQCGWKGYRKGDVGVHARQALVLVNYGQGTGKEIYDLSAEILQSVHERFDIELEREVNII